MLTLSLLFFRDIIISVYLEVRCISIDDNQKFVANSRRYAERTKLNASERKPGEEDLYSLKRCFRNMPILPRD